MSTLRPELENIEHVDLEMQKYLIVTIPPKKIDKFKDPYSYTEVDDSASQNELTGRESMMSAGESR